jgi:hypothetical protein
VVPRYSCRNIEGTGGTSSYIAIQGGKLNVGTAAKPVIMTSGLTTKAAGEVRAYSVVKHLSTV